MTIVTGKHKELLVELLIYHLTNRKFFTGAINNIKEQNNDGQWYINYYIDKGDEMNYHEPQNNNPEHTDEENNDSNG